MELCQRSSLIDGSSVYGRNNDTKRITEILLSDDCKSRTITPICMVADTGIGKTTMVQLIYTDKKVCAAFGTRILIQMSKGFDHKRLVKEIIESLTSGPCELNELSMLQSAAQEELREKKVLVILDGCENENSEFWNSLFGLLGFAEKGSVVLITTCNKEVARSIQPVYNYDLDYLSDQVCWHIFCQQALGGQSDIQPMLEKIRKDLWAKGPKNTLGIKLLGGLARCSVTDNWWINCGFFLVSTTKSWNNVAQLIKGCYDHLPRHLKQCFTYCSLFPKNHVFLKHHVVHLWLSQGFIKPTEGRELEYIGSQYFDELCNRSFFQHSPLHDTREHKFLMHGLIHDLVQQESQNEFFQSQDVLQSIPHFIQHFSIAPSAYHKVQMECLISQSEDLRSFLVINRSTLQLNYLPSRMLYIKQLEDLFLKSSGLRALDLSNTRIDGLPNSIEHLRNLQYLGLNNTTIRSIPEEVGALVSLQYLEARDCYYLVELPSNIVFLTNLRHLDVTKETGFVTMPVGIGKLTNLQFLSEFNVGSDEMHLAIKELKNMDNLKGCLLISGLQNVRNTLDAKETNLKNKNYLQTLSLHWTDGNEFTEDAEATEFQEKVLDNLQPSSNIHELIVTNYAGVAFPLWMEDPSFSNLVSVIIDSCPNCNCLPAFGELPSLKYLSVKNLFGVHTIKASKFPSLESLEIWEMYNLKELVVTEEGDCPHLNSLSINSCPLLRSIPRFCSLIELSIHYCSEELLQVPDVPSLQCLKIGGFQNIKCINLPQNLVMLKKLEIGHCNDLLSLVNLSNLTSIEELNINQCPNLRVNWKPHDHTKKEDSSMIGYAQEEEFNSCDEDIIKNDYEKEEDVSSFDENVIKEIANTTGINLVQIFGLEPMMGTQDLGGIFLSLQKFLFIIEELTSYTGRHSELNLPSIKVDEMVMSRLKLKFDEGVKESSLKKASALLNEFDRLLMRELRDLQCLANDVEEMIQFNILCATHFDKFKNELVLARVGKRKGEVLALFSPISLDSINLKIGKIIERLCEITHDHDELKFGEEDGHKLPKPMTLIPTSSLPRCFLQGREDEMKKLIEWLRSDDASDDTYSVKTIVGMGGVGKTSLMQHAYNKEIIQSRFDLKIWVSVSQLYNVVEVMKKMLDSIENNSPDLSELDSLHRTVIEHLRGKKILLVLDDMWDEDPGHWLSLQVPLNYAAKGSKVVVTTRSMKVSRIMCAKGYHLRCLSDDSSWLVCMKKVCQFHEIKLDNNMIEIGKKIASRCKGLPLAAEALGVSLGSFHTEEYWRGVLESLLLKENDEVSKILPALRVSYDSLPLHLKRCFAYCSLFPKGYVFEKNTLVHLWMAQGFINSDGSLSPEEMGCKYFDDLLDRCFMQHSPSHYASEGMYVMHDLYHELAEHVSDNEINRSRDCKVQKLHEKVRHSSVVPKEHGTIEAKLSRSGGQDLRSFLVVRENKHEGIPICMRISHEFFVLLDCLRALDLSYVDIENVPSSIGNLIHLRYLSFQNSRIRCLPESISGLFKLQTLNLRRCFYLEELPMGMKLLNNLRHLYLPLSTGRSMLMPYGMGQLTNLQTLPLYVVGSEREGCGIDELCHLKNLRGEMHISGMGSISDPQFAEDANMQNKIKVHKLTLEWLSDDSTSHLNEDLASEVLERVRPHPNLEELILMGFCGTLFPSWLGDQYLQKLCALDLKCCKNARILPPLGQLPSLKHLSVQYMAKLRQVGREFCGRVGSSSSTRHSHRGFPKLETLVFKKMDAWEGWFGVEDGDFPCLKYLSLKECSVLREWPQFPASVNVQSKRCPLLRGMGSEPLHLKLRNAEISHDYPLLILSECGSRFEETTIPYQVDRCLASESEPVLRESEPVGLQPVLGESEPVGLQPVLGESEPVGLQPVLRESEPVGLQPVLRQLHEYLVGPVLACMRLSSIAREARYFFNFDENRRALEESEDTLRSAAKSISIEVTEEIKRSNEIYPEVDDWVDRVNTVLYEKLSDEISFNFLCHCTDLISRFYLGKQVAEKHDRVIKLIDAKKAITKIGYTPGPPIVVPIHQPEPVGLQPVLRQLREYLDDETRSVIGVWGQGGVGKTTLLNAFNNDLFNYRGCFHVVILIDVSNSEALDVVGIQKTITERLGLPWVDIDEKSRAKDLCRALSKKRYVILLDDVARDFKLEDVGIPFPNNGSKIVLASRDRNVCSHMGAQQNLIGMATLDEAASQELFRSNLDTEALNAIGADPTINNYVDEIIKKCGGLPLALTVIGKSMAGVSSLVDWEYARRAITADLTELEGVEENMFRKLEYSYDRLGEFEKECFLSCTLFPEYSSIKKQQLVEYWMAEHLVPADKPWRGYLIINKLVIMCLLQRTNSELKVRMHNVIREFGLWSANKKNKFLVRSGKGLVNPPPPELFEGPEKISLMDNNLRNISLQTTCNNLQTLLLQNNPNFNSLGPNFFRFTPNLRVLDLSNTAIEEFPELPVHDASIPLQYLNLSKTPIRRLPDTFWVLKELRHLDISATENLETTSDNCSKLLKLRVLNLFRSHYGIWDESDLNLDSLKELWFLGIAIHAEDVLKKLKKTDPLAIFTNQLSLKHCDGMKSIHVADFNHMEHLNELYIESCDDLRELVVDETRESRLKLLTLWELGRLHSILVKSSPNHFQKLRELTIYECHKLSNISWVVGLDSLEKLVLSNCHGIKQVVMEKRNEVSREIQAQQGESSQQSNVRSKISTGETSEQKGESSQGLVNEDNKEFPKLRSIILIKLINLESICNARVFPCLESIRVQFCPNLRRLPIESKDNIPKLQQIGGSSDWWEELEWDVQEMKGHLEDIFIPYVTRSK